MNELLKAATRFFNAASALLEAALEKDYAKKTGTPTEPNPNTQAPPTEAPVTRKPRKATVETTAGMQTTTAPDGMSGSVSVPPPVKQEPESGNVQAGAEKMTTETARPRVLAVAQKVGSQAVKDLIKKQTGCAALADVPADKLPALVAAVEKLGADADV